MADDAPFFPGLSPVAGKPVHIDFDGGRLTSDAGVVLLAEIERKLRVAERLACCIADLRAPERVRHSLVGVTTRFAKNSTLTGCSTCRLRFGTILKGDYERNFPGRGLAEPIPSANVRLCMPLKYHDIRLNVQF